jgi:hypothetical protein
MNDFWIKTHGPKMVPIVEQLDGLTDEELSLLVAAIRRTRRLLIPNWFALEHADAMMPGRFNAETWAAFADWCTHKSGWDDEVSEVLQEKAQQYEESLADQG